MWTLGHDSSPSLSDSLSSSKQWNISLSSSAFRSADKAIVDELSRFIVAVVLRPFRAALFKPVAPPDKPEESFLLNDPLAEMVGLLLLLRMIPLLSLLILLLDVTYDRLLFIERTARDLIGDRL